MRVHFTAPKAELFEVSVTMTGSIKEWIEIKDTLLGEQIDRYHFHAGARFGHHIRAVIDRIDQVYVVDDPQEVKTP